MSGFQVAQGRHHHGRQACLTKGAAVVKEPSDSKNTVDPAVPASKAAGNLSEKQKKALELAERAEHAIGRKREALQKEARRKAEDG
jgi:hypothetical protein